MYILLSLAAISSFAVYLLILVNKQQGEIYSWQREIEYKDYVNSRLIKVNTPSEYLTISSVNRSFNIQEMLNDLEYKISELETGVVPYKLSLLSYVSDFYSNRNIFASLESMADANYSVFLSPMKVDGPSVFIEKDVYNIFINYSIHKGAGSDLVNISNQSDYQDFLKNLYKFSDDYTCKVIYSVYKRLGKNDKGELISTLSLAAKIGQSFSNVNYTKPYITEIEYFSEG